MIVLWQVGIRPVLPHCATVKRLINDQGRLNRVKTRKNLVKLHCMVKPEILETDVSSSPATGSKDHEFSVFVPEILRETGKVKIIQMCSSFAFVAR